MGADDDDDLNKHEWEKPAWAKDGPKLKSTGKAEAMKTSGNLAKEITHVNANKDASRDVNSTANTEILHQAGGAGEKDVSWEKPSWTKGAGLKSAQGTEKDVSWEKPAWAQNAGLKSTKKGEKLKENGNLAKPITFPKGK